METPFKYGTLADKDTFVNRTEERIQLLIDTNMPMYMNDCENLHPHK